MTCKHLSTYRIAQCQASEELLIPSLLELSEFCHNHFQECPIYKQAESDFKKRMHVAGTEEDDKALKIG
jgi:hypothetical protein